MTTRRTARSGLTGLLALLFGSWPAVSLSAEPAPAADPGDDGSVEEMVVSAQRVENTWLEVPAAVSVVETDEIQRARQQLSLGESLVGVPGVFTQNRNNFAQDLRISIRGFGSRARFGIRGIRLIVDGIPQTLPDGQGQVDSLQLATAGRIEVIRGPAASLYGSAAGGVIRIESEPSPEIPYVSARAAGGRYGYGSFELKSAGQAGPASYLVGLTYQRLEGYRDHSRMQSTVLNSRLQWAIGERSDLTALLGFVYAPIADDPGGITELEVAQDRTQAAPRNLRFDAGERVNQLTGGLRFRHDFDDQNETSVTAHFGGRDFANRLPFAGECTEAGPPGGALGELDRFFGGGTLQHRYSDEYFGHPNRLLAGFDVEVQRDDRLRRCNYASWVGRRTLDQREEVTSLRGFLQDEFGLHEKLELTASLGYDALLYRVVDRMPVSAGDPDGSDSFWFTQWSPMVGLRWSPAQAANPYLRISTSFEPPSTTELRSPLGGGFNTSLDAQRAVNYEVGTKGLVVDRLRYELAVYYIRIRDELIAYEIGGDPFFQNAGETSRFGVEAGFSLVILPGLLGTATYTYSGSRFEDYIDAVGRDFSGNQVPGVPEHLFFMQLAYEHDIGLRAAFDLRYIGRFFADDANRVETEPYWVADLRVDWELRLGRWGLSPFVGVNNLFGAEYIDNVRLNAAGGRYWEPAPEIDVYGGLGLAYHFEGP